jgi:purine-nucleoside phosphorylase
MSEDLDRFRSACRESRPSTFLVLGSGLGVVVERFDLIARLGFADVPGLPPSGVEGHRGAFILGRFGSAVVLVGAGRLHFYEGHPWSIVTRPIEFAAEMGVCDVILTNAAGGIRSDLEPGRIMPIQDHMECVTRSPWWVRPESSPYDAGLLADVLAAGSALGMSSRPGVYAALTGPSYETPAEIRALRVAGADAVGMSTSREALAGRAAGLRCAAISLITNRAAGLGEGDPSHADVLAAGRDAAGCVGDLLEEVVRRTNRL